MRAPPRLTLVPVSADINNTSNVVHISAMGPQGPAPRRAEWRELMRRIVKDHGKGDPGNGGKPGF